MEWGNPWWIFPSDLPITAEARILNWRALSPRLLEQILSELVHEEEIVERKILNSEVAAEFWRLAGCPPQVQASFSGGLVDWLQVNAHSPLRAVHKDYPWKCFFLFGVWNLWLQRNRKAFKQQEASLNLVQAVEMQVREFFYCVANQDEIRNKEILHVRWSKPGDGWLKLNTDGSFGGEGVNSGCGGLIRDSNGLWIRGFAKTVVVNSSLASEMWALREGLTLCLDLQPQAMEIKLDATAAISFLSGNSNTNGDLSGLVDDCRDLLLQLPQVRMLHCYREANSCADALARLGAAGDGGDSYFVTPPHSVIPLLNFDFMGKHRTAISFLSGNSNTNGDLSGLVDDCRDLLLQLPQVRMLHCYREANSCADALARLGAAGDGGDSYFVTPPHSVIPLLNFDFMGKHRSRLGSPVCETSIVY
nr:putative ribonuclease h protein [Quercus suber]